MKYLKVRWRRDITLKEGNLLYLGNNHDTSSTYGSNSWMTLSNLKTEKSLVENAEEKEKRMDQCITFVFSIRETML